MNKLFFGCCAFALASSLSAQIRINVPNNAEDQSAIVQINNSDQLRKGFTLPRVQLTDKKDFTPFETEPKVGLIVFNTLKSTELEIGVYSWTGTMWELSSNNKIKEYIQQDVDFDFLGYTPLYVRASTGNSRNKRSFVLEDGTKAYATLIKCEERTITDLTIEEGKRITNTYCLHSISGSETSDVPLSSNLTWYDAFLFAKEVNGHLLTVTDDSEWDFLKQTIFNENYMNHASASRNTWLGSIRMNDRHVATVNLPESNRDRMKFYWITNERSIPSWTDNRGYQTQFDSGYPFVQANEVLNTSNSSLNNNDITNYAVYVTSKSTNPNRNWRTINSNGLNQKIRSYNSLTEMVEMPPITVNNGNTDDFKSVSIIVEYTNDISL